MSLSATATAQADWAPPRVEVEATAGSPLVDNTAVTCVRVHSDGTRHPVITQSDLRLSSMSAIFWDYHPPRGMAFSYEVTVGAEMAVATAMQWVATDPNIMPVDTGTGGEARMLEWVRASGGLTTTPNVATVAPGDMITATIPVEEGIVYSVGVDTSDDAMLILQYKSGRVSLGSASEAQGIGATRPFLSLEAPSGSRTLEVSVRNNAAGNITVSQPTVLVGLDYPTAAPPTQETTDGAVSVDVGSDEVWLLHRSNPALSVRLDALVSITMPQRANWVGSSRIPGRAKAVHVTDGILHGGQGEIEVRCDSDASLSALVDDLLDDGSQILIATPGGEGWDLPWEWVQPFTAVPSNPANRAEYPYRHVVISFEQTDQPAVAGVGIRTYAAAKAEFVGLTKADVKLLYATYRDAKTDTRVA